MTFNPEAFIRKSGISTLAMEYQEQKDIVI
jgi:hypothetical protein